MHGCNMENFPAGLTRVSSVEGAIISTVQREVQKLTKNWQHFSTTSSHSFQMPVELLAEASLKKKFFMYFQWWQTVLLE